MKTIALLMCLCLAPVPNGARKPIHISPVMHWWRGNGWVKYVTRESTNQEWYFSTAYFNDQQIADYIDAEDKRKQP